jgi:hypothetical protein
MTIMSDLSACVGSWRRTLLPLFLSCCWLFLLMGPDRAWGEVSASGEVPAQQKGSTPAAGEEAEDETLLERTIEAMDERHEQISDRVLATADWLDSFFASDRIDAEAQKTRLVMGFSLFAEDSQAVEFDLGTRFRLSLPFLTERMQLVFSGDPDDDVGAETVPRRDLRRRLREQREQTVTVGLRYQLRQTLLSNTSLRAGVRLRKGTPVLLLEPRYRQDLALGPYWLLRFTQRLIAFSNDTYEVRTTFDLERPLDEVSEELFFRITAEGNWFSDRPGYEPALHVNLFQTLSPRRALDYRISNFFQTRPNFRRENTVLSVLYRQMLGRDWLYGEVAPQLAFPRDRNFKATPGILLNLGVIFGAY